jgi:hypothetical protein
MIERPSIARATLALALLSSCIAVPLEPYHTVAATQPTPTGAESAVVKAEEPRLYARDGAPVSVDGSESASETAASAPPSREFKQGDGSRLYLLELYQRAVDERDELVLEVSAREKALAQSEVGYAELEQKNTALGLELADLRTRVAGLEDENFDLAGRLATAQIRRLEAEKLLLEATIEWDRLNAANQVAGLPADDAEAER